MSALEPDRWQAITPYLDQALELAEDEREMFVSSLRGHDAALAHELELLLAEHRLVAAERFLERPAMAPLGGPAAGHAVGAYTLLSPIGSGGMGTVWLAGRSDGRFERQVAIKFLSVALAGRGEERFRREGRILARLTHANIARLIDAGVAPDGQPYLVLEHVAGTQIDRYCADRGLAVADRVRLFLRVLDAVAHAHANLIVHRDIKPSNVLVTADGGVKLLDFGIATLVDDDRSATRVPTRDAGAMTPSFAAPEQLTGGAVTTATDVYALGVLLYVLLADRHPAGEAAQLPAELVKAIVERDPGRPSSAAEPGRRRALAGDLDTAVLKALKKRPDERYASVTAFADDLRRYLNHEPLAARPDTLAYRAAKFVRRNRAITALAAVAIVASAAGIIGTTMAARTASAQRDFALRQLSRAEAINDLNAFLLTDAAPLGRPFTVNDLLARAEHIVERQQNRQDPARIETLISIGRQYWTQDEDARSRRVLAAAYGDSRGIGDRAVRAKASCALAGIEGRGSDLGRAESLFQEGLAELGRAPELALDRVFCLLTGAFVSREAGNAQQAIARVEEAQRELQASPIKSELLELRALADLAETYRVAGRHFDAASVFERLMPRLTALGRDDTQTAGTWFNNWGMALSGMGRPLDAERAFRRGIDVSRADASESAVSPMLLNNYARVLRELGRLDEAASYAERACSRAREAGDVVVVHQSTLLRAWIYIDRREFDRADAMLAEVTPAFRQKFQRGHIALAALASYGSLLAQGRGDLAAAMRLADEAIDSVDAAVKAGRQGVDALPILLVRRSAIALQLGDLDRAEADARRAVALLDKANPPDARVSTTGRAYLALARALDARGRRDAARDARRVAAAHLISALGADHRETHEAQQ
jgi:eukaryotic-like serine/threonine-protein kinase